MGLPLCWLLYGRRPLREADYVRAPFLGAAAITLIVQNLYYQDVTVRRAAPLVWGLIAALWLWAWRRGQLRLWWRGCPRALLTAGLLAFAVQGLGLLRLGAREYFGRAFPDQFNYTSIAQFALEEPFSLPLAAVGHRPYLIQGVRLKDHRNGAPLLQGFFAASCGADAKPLFEPTALLLPPLTVFAAFGLGRQLGLARPHALLAAAAAGLLPAVAAVHLEGFLSQALGLPFLLAYPLFLSDLSERPSAGRWIAAALCAAAGHTFYVELYPLFVGASAVLLGAAAVGDCRRWRLPACAVALAFAPALLNPFFVRSGWHMMTAVTLPVLQDVYPWALRQEGLARLWAGDFAALPGASALLAAGAVAATAVAYFGLLRACAARLCRLAGEGDPAARWRDLGMALAVLALALVPVAVVLKDREHPYQFYKLANTVSPLLVVGLMLALRPGRIAAPAWPALAAAAPVLLLAGAASGSMAVRSTRVELTKRSLTALVCGPGLTDLARGLERRPGGPLLIASVDAAYNPWLAYLARRHRAWLLGERINDSAPFERMPEVACVADLRGLPEGCLLLGTELPWLSCGRVAGARLVQAAGPYRLWRTTTRTWAVPTRFVSPAGAGADEQGPYFLVGRQPTRLEVLASCPGKLTVKGRFPARLLVAAEGPGGCREREAPGGNSAWSWRVPLAVGTTVLTFQAADGPPVLVHGLRLRFAASPANRLRQLPGEARAR
jgi:hypothetical protein